MTVSPLDALSALSGVQLPNAGALNGALNGATSTAGPAGSIPIGLTAPVGEGFGQILQGPLSAQELQGAQAVQATAPPAASGGSSPSTWGHMVQQMVMDVNNKQQNANALVNDVLKGGPTPVHQAMIASEEASLSFEFLATVRNKVIDAYNTVMQM
jgi:flagellar hook-basal body complex protein FliE